MIDKLFGISLLVQFEQIKVGSNNLKSRDLYFRREIRVEHKRHMRHVTDSELDQKLDPHRRSRLDIFYHMNHMI